MIDDPDPVGEDIRLLEVLGGEEDRHSLLLHQPCDLFPQRRAALRVEAGGGLVEEEDPRPVHQGQSQIEAPFHSARVLAHAAVSGVPQADAVDELLGALPALCLRDALEGRLEVHVLPAVQVRVEGRLLKGNADRRADLGPLLDDVVSRDAGRPSVGGSKVVSMWTVVDLPAPFGPRKP